MPNTYPPPADDGRPTLVCPVCQHTSFTRETGRLMSRWAFASHRLYLLVCARCTYVLPFYEKRGTMFFG